MARYRVVLEFETKREYKEWKTTVKEWVRLITSDTNWVSRLGEPVFLSAEIVEKES